MDGYDNHRAFRVDLSETVSQEIVIDFLKQQQIIKAAIYHEIAQQTKKPHLQGWMAFSGEADVKAFSKKWTVFKRNHKLDKSKSSVAKFRKGDTAMVYAAKDGNIVWQHGVTDEELEELSKRSYQKGETKKQTFLNAIVQRMKEKNAKSKSAVYYELCEYYYENGKELSPWRLMPQCNTVCRMLWGEKFSRHMADTEVRINFYATEEDDAPPPPGSEEDSEASDSEAGNDDQGQSDVLQEVVCRGTDNDQRDVVVHVQELCDCAAASSDRVPEPVQPVQGTCVEVHVPAHGDGRRHFNTGRQRTSRHPLSVAATAVHNDRQERQRDTGNRGRSSTVQQRQDDQGAVEGIQHISQGSERTAGDGDDNAVCGSNAVSQEVD